MKVHLDKVVVLEDQIPEKEMVKVLKLKDFYDNN